MPQFVLVSSRPVDTVQQQIASVHVTSFRPPAWAVNALTLNWEDLDPYVFPLVSIMGKVVDKLQDYSCNRIILIDSG